MESFYSIIYLKPNALSDEHLAVGLFTGGGEGPFLFLSESRMRLYKLITRKITYLAIQRLLYASKQKVDGYRGNQAELRLFDPLYSKEEFMKLKKMSKGTVVFSEPTVSRGAKEKGATQTISVSLNLEKVCESAQF